MSKFSFGKRKNFSEINSVLVAKKFKSNTNTNFLKSKSDEIEIKQIEVLPEYQEVKNLILEKFPLIFVTGGAGTGKSTFIRWLDNEFQGKTLLCAPSGVAALTISGKTIHSLCRFPPSWIVEEDIKIHPKSLAKQASLLIIDEISMVNANLLDGMDKFFKKNRGNNLPFGGITVVMVGDLFQLPPIVTPSTAPLFKKEYFSPKFFASNAIQKSEFHVVELTKAFRQVDQDFVDLLGQIREGSDLEEAITELNSRCKITDYPPDGTIWLAPRHADIEKVNAERLNRLPGKLKNYTGETTGKFNDKQLPVPIQIDLKIGAQVMMAKNSKEWINGSVATVTDLFNDRIRVKLATNSKVVDVPVNTWEQFDYALNPETNAIERVVVGTYKQIPVILAWAITIHKSQGLTLDKVHLDLGNGAFETGQTYVALSRCRSLKTLSMSRKLLPSDVLVDDESRSFYSAIRL